MSQVNLLASVLVCLSGLVILLLLYIAHLTSVYSKRIRGYEDAMEAIRAKSLRTSEGKRRFKRVRSAHLDPVRMDTANTLQPSPTVDGSGKAMRFLPPRTSRTRASQRRSGCCNGDNHCSGSRDY